MFLLSPYMNCLEQDHVHLTYKCIKGNIFSYHSNNNVYNIISKMFLMTILLEYEEY